MRNDKAQLNEAAVQVKTKKCSRKKLALLPSPFPNNWEIKIRRSGSVALPSPAVWARCICRAHTFPSYCTGYLEDLLGALRCGSGAGSTKGRRHWTGLFYFPDICIIQWGYCRKEGRQFWVPSPGRDITRSEFSWGPRCPWETGVLSLWGEAEGTGDILLTGWTAAPGAYREASRRWSQALHSGAWKEAERQQA